MSLAMIMIAFATVWVGLAVLGLVLSVKFGRNRQAAPNNAYNAPRKTGCEDYAFDLMNNPVYSDLPGNVYHRIGD